MPLLPACSWTVILESDRAGTLGHAAWNWWRSATFLASRVAVPRNYTSQQANCRNGRSVLLHGHGDPGRAHEDEYDNCLIDSLRQCVGIVADRKLVRDDLMQEFHTAVGRAQVTQTSFLDVESHWRAILQSLFKHNTCGAPAQCDIRQYCVIALDATNPGNGNVNGNLSASNRLVVMNTSDIHFDPCLRLLD